MLEFFELCDVLLLRFEKQPFSCLDTCAPSCCACFPQRALFRTAESQWFKVRAMGGEGKAEEGEGLGQGGGKGLKREAGLEPRLLVCAQPPPLFSRALFMFVFNCHLPCAGWAVFHLPRESLPWSS